MRPNRLRQIWAEGGSVVNGWLAIPGVFSTEVMAAQGWDSLTVDMQHGVVDYQAMVSMLAAIATSNAVPVVRVPWLDPAAIMKALDAGAYGVIVPMVNTPEDAQRLVDWTTYAPKGGRSYGPIRAMLYGGADYPAHADATIVRFAMIETKQALDNLDAILATPGLDAVYVGPSDLSLSLGCAPKFEDLDPPAAAAVQTIVDKATAAGVIPGIHCGSVAGALGRVRQGFRFVTIGSDNRFMATGAAETVKGMRAGLAKG